jgi:ABC-type transport system involved in multi-copper enzyme maturation permease subunit
MRGPGVKLPPMPPLGLSPITSKELIGRMRNARSYTALTIYLTIVSALAVLLYLVGFLSGPRTLGGAGAVGTVVFFFLVGMQVLLVTFVAPAFSVGAISGERERMTFDLLRATTISPRQIVLAKLVSALGFTLLLIFATLPLFSLAFLLGGVEPTELGITLCVTLSSALLFTLIGLYVSSRSKTTVGAAVVTYAVTLGIVVGVPLASLIGSSTIELALASASTASRGGPAVAAVEALLTLAISVSPISAIVASQRFFALTGDVLTFVPGFFSSGGSGLTLLSPFVILTGLYLIASAVLFVLTVRRVGRVEDLP